MGLNPLDEELEALRAHRSDLINQLGANREVTHKNYSHVQFLRREINRCDERIIQNINSYRRPNGVISRPISRMLGPLPPRMQEMDLSRMDQGDLVKEMQRLPDYEEQALLLLGLVLLPLAGLCIRFPWLLFSTTSLLPTPVLLSFINNRFLLVILTAVIAMFTYWAFQNKDQTMVTLEQSALGKEQWFRSGAEGWSTRQRLTSCLLFGMYQPLTLVFPFIGMIMLSIAGAGFMVAYRKEYDRSRNTYRATLAATKLHAQYNAYLLIVISVIIYVITLYSLA